MRRFLLVRHSDPSGVSGTGIVAQGVEFDDGAVAVRWPGKHASTTMWTSIRDAKAIHGHGGKTVVQFLDDFETDLCGFEALIEPRR